jgi:hypothetical protein
MMNPTALNFLVLASVVSSSIVLTFYTSSLSVQKISAQPPINSTFFGNTTTAVNVQPIQPFNTTNLGTHTALRGVFIIPDLEVVVPTGGTSAYTCTSEGGKKTCESQKGNVLDALTLWYDSDKVCIPGTVVIDNTSTRCDWKQ